jgi:phosphomannomutase
MRRGTPGRYATTIVSSSLLKALCAARGYPYGETLTGFKWIVRAGAQRPGSYFLFGYEEALGYAVGDVVRDKDGIGAALAVLGLAATARSGGESLHDAYDALEATHWVHLTSQVTVPTTSPADVMARLRERQPDELAGLPVTEVTDLAAGTGELPPADVLSYRLPGARVVIRPSGTEPKMKAYLQVLEPVDGGRLGAARRAAEQKMTPLRAVVCDLLGR